MIDDLLRIAEELAAHGGAGRPRQAYLRRSLSTIYYALFHVLARLCADELIGVTRANTDPWVRAYRALDHGEAKKSLRQDRVRHLDPAVRMFADLFVDFQEKRHVADYDPRPFPYSRRVVRRYVEQARQALDALSQLDSEHRRVVATAVLLKSRP